ncbi:MAG: MmcQ/YjbR family DNA-binding protein [Myxococcota bacterium]|nr:MmcQ/YjbR family DNA-binding protein [Myxococcota bacterium]
MAKARNPLARVRKIIGAWPETSEKLSHGAPTFWGGRKTFATLHDNHHGDGRQALWIKSTADAQDSLVATNPELFFVPPYLGPSGWIGVRLDRGANWAMVESLLEEGYRSVAPKRALKQLDEQP